MIALIDSCVFGFVARVFHGNLDRIRAAGAEVALVAEWIKRHVLRRVAAATGRSLPLPCVGTKGLPLLQFGFQ